MPQPSKKIKPDGIRYWVEDRPPLPLSLMLALQQVAFLGSLMTLPVVLGRAARLGVVDVASLVTLTMIGAGIGVMLQALNRFGIGVGLFAPMHSSSVAFPAALVAVKTGGLGLAFGMMSIAGLVQICASRFITKLRAFFPVEIAGLTVFMLGSGLGLVGLKNFLGIGTEFQCVPSCYIVGFFTLIVIVVLNLWTRGLGRAFSVFIGLIAGQALAYQQGLVPDEAIRNIVNAAPFAIPSIGKFGWSLDWRLVPDFVIVGLALSFNCYGVITIAQRANDSGWKSPDMGGVGRGLLAEGLTNIACSAINGVPQTASGGAVGLAEASGVTGRIVAFVLGGLFIVLAFFPSVAMAWISLSPSVIGAVLIFVASFITIGGLKIMTSRLLDNRKTICLGIAIIAGLGHDTLLVQLDHLPKELDSIFATSLSITVLVAVLLNALFKLGSKKKLSHKIALDHEWPDSVNQLIWHLGHQWSARSEVVARLDHATNELIDVIAGHNLIEGEATVDISVAFDEYGCTLKVCYRGEGFHLPTKRPAPEDLLDNPDAVRDMAGYLIHHLADSVKINTSKNITSVTLHFSD